MTDTEKLAALIPVLTKAIQAQMTDDPGIGDHWSRGYAMDNVTDMLKEWGIKIPHPDEPPIKKLCLCCDAELPDDFSRDICSQCMPLPSA